MSDALARKPASISAKVRFDELSAAMMRCERCAALVRTRSRVVPGAGALPATVAFIGLAPGRFGGDRTGVPFDGDRSGAMLRRMIRIAGLRRVFITNVVRCNPRDAAGCNRDPAAGEIANCRGHLRAELELARPRIVACLGKVAWRELAGRAVPFTPEAPRLATVGGMRLFAMYHLGYVIRGAYPESSYARDFARLADLVRSPAASGRAVAPD